MIKHPGPWTLHPFGNIHDANKELVCGSVTENPETRAVLLHAAEMWEILRDIVGVSGEFQLEECQEDAGELLTKIESEIAKGKP